MIRLKPTEDLNGFLDQGSEIRGELRFRDTLRIDGRARGRIVSENLLIVGETAHVDADIDCGIVSIRGTVAGRVVGRQRIELLAGCRVTAALASPSIVIEDGAFFEGQCDMMSALPSPPSGKERA